jgi:predicted metal-dependent hydrolase
MITFKDSPENRGRLNSTIKSLYEVWLYSQAKKIFRKKVKDFSKVLGVNPKKIVIKNLKNRWGSITQNETMNLNLNLVKAPEDVIDYIIVHELSHLKIKGHSHKFWTYIHKFVPDYEDKINWLVVNGRNLLL